MKAQSKERVSSLAKDLTFAMKLIAFSTVKKRSEASTAPALKTLHNTSCYISENGFDFSNEDYEVRGHLYLELILDHKYCRFDSFDLVSTADELGERLGGLSGFTVNRLRRAGKLIGIKHRRTGRFLYPNYQIKGGKLVDSIVSKALDPGFLALLTILKRTDTTKAETLEALRLSAKSIGERGFPSVSEIEELDARTSLRSALLDEHYPFDEEGGVSTAEELGKALGGLSSESVDCLRREGKLIGYKQCRHGRYLYPNFQLANGKILDGIESCVSVFRKSYFCKLWRSNAWTVIKPMWNSEGDDFERPIDHLRNGNTERAIQLLETYLYRLD